MTRHTLTQEILGTLGVVLGNEQIRCIVVDRPTGALAYVMAYRLPWAELSELMENGINPLKHLVFGGPVEGERP